MEALANMNRGDIKKENAVSLLQGSDVHEEELIVMAETAAYFHVAYKVCSLYSIIPMHRDHFADVLSSCSESLTIFLV
jgi:hypothetical protein